jgi:hypothetical protein
MKLKVIYNFQFFLLAVSLSIQVILTAGLIYLSNKTANIIDTDAIDKFINEEKLNSANESDQKLLRLAYTSREIRIQAKKLISQENDVMRATSKLLIVSIVIQIVLFIFLVKTKKDNIRLEQTEHIPKESGH